MAECHLDRDILEAFSRGALAPGEAHQVEAHLRSGCPACQGRVDAILRSFTSLESTAGPEADENASWDRLFAKVEQRLILLSMERSVAPHLVSELLDRPPAERETVLATQSRFRSVAVCELLIEQSFAAGFEDPALARELAELALGVADLLDAGYYGRTVVQDFRARAWAHLGNARRVGSDLTGADEALHRAEELLGEGSADPLEEARVRDLRASLLSDQGWFEEAANLLDSVIEIYEDLQDTHRKGRALISQGLFLSYAGRADAAVARLTGGLAAIDWEAEPRLSLMARHNLAWSLNDCGRSGEAQRLLERFRQEYQSFPDFWTELRLGWLEGRIALRMGREEEAERGLCEVCARFREKGLCYDASLVMIDLAGLYLKQGKSAAVRRLAEEMLATFLSQDVHRHAAGALLALRTAAEMDGATPALLQEIAVYLQRTRKNPALQFRPLTPWPPP